MAVTVGLWGARYAVAITADFYHQVGTVARAKAIDVMAEDNTGEFWWARKALAQQILADLDDAWPQRFANALVNVPAVASLIDASQGQTNQSVLDAFTDAFFMAFVARG